jgi:hypothetical protein
VEGENDEERLMSPDARFVWSALSFRTPPMLAAVAAVSEQEFTTCAGHPNPIAWLLWHIAEVEDNWVRDKLLGQPKRYPFGLSVKDPSRDRYASKAELLAYFDEVRNASRLRLQAMSDPEFDRGIEDEHYGHLTARDLWAGVATSCAWHGGQIVFLARVLRNTSVQ